MEPHEKMKVEIQNLLLGKPEGGVKKSYARESLTFIVNEHTVQRRGEGSEENLSKTRVFYHFKITSPNPDPRSESILTFWNVDVRIFLFFVCTGSKIKVMLIPRIHDGIVTVDFSNPGDAQQFWYYSFISRLPRKVNPHYSVCSR